MLIRDVRWDHQRGSPSLTSTVGRTTDGLIKLQRKPNFDYGGGKKREEEELVFCSDKKINPLINCKSLIIIITLKSNFRGILKEVEINFRRDDPMEW